MPPDEEHHDFLFAILWLFVLLDGSFVAILLG